jgi:integrase
MVNEQPQNSLLPILQYTPPRLYTGKEWYIGFYAVDPAQNKMRRKKIKLNFITKASERRTYASGLMKRLNMQLMNGWNPWIEADNSRAYHILEDVFEHYRRFMDKMFSDNIYRKDTYDSYISYLKNVEEWNNGRTDRAAYIYQFDGTFVRLLLEYIYIERGNSPQTRDNYLGWLRTFSTWLVQQQYLKVKPTSGFVNFGKRTKKKKRTCIAANDMLRIKNYVESKNKHYLLGCYMLFYCFVRPKEIGKIKIRDISLERQTLFIPDVNSKNRKDGTITIPAKVLFLMIDLNVFNYPGDYYLFSDNFMPGKEHKNEKQFRDFWTRELRPALKLPANYKFYSLKDTGITSMLRTQASITVRDQARHSTLLMTDTYTPHDIQQANDLIKNHETAF